ncbi:MAG TPA: chromosome segregation protein SMC [Burkholderiales bacterium]|nr:chromosome segregation protein SMC [Burkholderiales bacterium]
MRLKQINLAGFKSFVDPTHIPVPGQLVGIVGPNGCGKSNVIDAVRWVLGETSARHLRGETMQDVLFNGSGQRQPVSRASVELVFDNSLGKAGGQWASYAEISVRRVLNRDADSSYYINNLHVRRRDVADIFLGTGLGSRAYAIIEQGMISRVIEAKPEELRVFLEEAAGVSKYRERRRETELRLRDTRDNLQRVEDIRQELQTQLEHLQAQAEVATRYHERQNALRTTQSLLWLVRRQEASAQRARHAREIERLGLELESEIARLRETESRLETMRAQHYRASDEVQSAQGAFYESNADTARLEQEIAHQRENRNRAERDIAELQGQQERHRGQLSLAQSELARWRESHAQAEQRLAESEQLAQAEADKLPVAEETFRATRQRHDELQRSLALAEQRLEVERTKHAHALQLQEQLAQRAQRLREENESLEPVDDEQQRRLQREESDVDRQLRDAQSTLSAQEAELPVADQAAHEADAALDLENQKLGSLEARLQALVQLQERLSRGTDTESWLASHGLDRAPRLWHGIQIEKGWEDALEAVLRERLNAIAVEQLGETKSWFEKPPPGRVAVYAPTAGATRPGEAWKDYQPLRRYVSCSDPRTEAVMGDWLHQVFVVPGAIEGLSAREALPAGAMLVTREGHTFTRQSVSFHAPDTELHGVLSRQREIESLETSLAAVRTDVAAARARAERADRDVEERRQRIDELRQKIGDLQQRHHALQIEAQRLAQTNEHSTERARQIAGELSEVEAQGRNASETSSAAQAQSVQLRAEADALGEQLALASELYHRAEAVLGRQRDALQQARDAVQQTSFVKSTCDSKINEISSSIKAIREESERLSQTLQGRHRELSGYQDGALQDELQKALAVRGEREQVLARARDAQAAMEGELKGLDEERHTHEQKLEPLREKAAEVRLKEQEARLNEEQYTQNLVEAGSNEEELAASLEKGTRPGALQAEIARLQEEIKDLGAVNLAALEELQAARERKEYLDSQSRDLSEAMATLEDAIRRIDRETRERLQTTFDDVNRHFGELFPALFGGGHAHLLLTGEEILDAGVQVIAQPPGKKNTSIHLLSGGEKALTALALVFSLFQLNPAPFCLLDEVDAPLDDNNTARFCDLVKRMSQQSQFLFISHNKITMEVGEQLLGITMQEPGVSRVVAVDIEEAMKLTEEAA